MKSKLLAAAAAIAFIASGVVAKAQENPNHEQRPAAERSAPNAQHMAPQPAQAPRAAEAQPREEPRRNEAEAPNQAPRADQREAPRAAQTEERNTPGQAEERRRAVQTEPNRAQEPRRNEERRTSQEQPNRMAEPNGQRDNRMAEPNGQREKGSAARTGENDNNRNAPLTAEHQEGRGQPRVVGNVKSSQEHATRVGEMLQREGHREHADFGINVGTRVPENFAVYPLPAEILGFAPEYRGYDYFVDDNDEIVFVSPETHEIVGAIDYEGRAASDEPMTNVAGARPCPIEN